MAAAKGVRLHHIARETTDVKRLATFYQQVPSSFSPSPHLIDHKGTSFMDFERHRWRRLIWKKWQVLGFEKVESPDFGDFEVVWLVLGSQISLHLIERSPSSRLAEGPCNSSGAVDLEPGHLPRGHHLAFDVENYASFVNSLKVLSFSPLCE